MRAEEFYETAASDLKDRLTAISKPDYNNIDQLMKRISSRYKITGKKLHDIFVSKYGETPDHWIKQYKANLEEESTDESMLGFLTSPKPAVQKKKEIDYSALRQLAKSDDSSTRVYRSPAEYEKARSNQRVTEDEIDNTQNIDQIKDFIRWSLKQLNVQKPYPKFTISKNTKQAQDGHHTGMHSGKTIWVYVGNRNLIDIFRTIFHELTHERQFQLDMIDDGDSYPGSPVEALADMMAGKYIKIYGKAHPEIFQ